MAPLDFYSLHQSVSLAREILVFFNDSVFHHFRPMKQRATRYTEIRSSVSVPFRIR